MPCVRCVSRNEHSSDVVRLSSACIPEYAKRCTGYKQTVHKHANHKIHCMSWESIHRTDSDMVVYGASNMGGTLCCDATLVFPLTDRSATTLCRGSQWCCAAGRRAGPPTAGGSPAAPCSESARTSRKEAATGELASMLSDCEEKGERSASWFRRIGNRMHGGAPGTFHRFFTGALLGHARCQTENERGACGRPRMVCEGVIDSKEMSHAAVVVLGAAATAEWARPR